MNKQKFLLTIICLVLVTATSAQKRWHPEKRQDFSLGSAIYSSMVIGSDNSIYVSYLDKYYSGGVGKITVMKHDGTDWDSVGIGGIFEDGEYPSLVIDDNDTLYLAMGGCEAVLKFNGTSWDSVGGVFSTTGTAGHPSLALDTNNRPCIVYLDGGNGSNVRQKVKRYNGTNWVLVGNRTFAADNNSIFNSASIVVDKKNTIYIAYQDSAADVGIAWKYTNTWTALPNYFSDVNYPELGIGENDTLYVKYRNGTTSARKLNVKKYNGSSWAAVGAADFSKRPNSLTKLAFDNNHTPYVVYGNNGLYLNVMKFDGSSWVYVGQQDFSHFQAAYPSIAFDTTNRPYVAFMGWVGGTNQKANLMSTGDSTTWGGPTGGPYAWDAGEPDSLTDAVIATLGATGNFSCKNLTIDYNNFVNFGSGSIVNVYGDINSLQSGNGITSLGRINLVKDGTTTISGYDIKPLGHIVVDSGTNLFIDSNTTLTIDSTLELKSNLSTHDNATLDISGGKLLLSGTTAQTLNLGHTGHKIVTVEDMELDNSAGASFGYGIIDVRGDYIPTAGTLISNNRLRLVSDATYKGRIAQGSSSGGYITGNIVARLYIPGSRRAFRFIAHSAPDTKPLSGITDNIDITGSGGSTNGFTTTQSNYPSAFYFDVDSADNSTAGNNPGWKPFTTANVNNWYKGQVMRVLVRGAKGQGLNGVSYTPSAATLGMNQQVNQGDQTVTLTKGANTNFVLVGNPFPSQVQLNTVARGSNVGSNFYIWNPNQGVKGAYTSHQFSTSYVLPQWGAFVTTVSANTNNTMVFEEADKTDGTPATQFKTTASKYVLELSIADTSYSWDKLLLNFDDDGYAVQDKLDAVKLNNPGLDFYTVSQDGTDLSIDVRPSKDKEVIPLGVDVWHYGGSGTFTITASEFNLPTGATLTFHDKYLNQQVLITDSFSYTFTTNDADTMSGGKHRFHIGVANLITTIENTATNNVSPAQVQLYPNPADGVLHLAYKNLVGTSSIRIYDMTGKVVYQTVNNSIDGNGLIELSTENLTQGIYIVELKSEHRRFTQKLIKN